MCSEDTAWPAAYAALPYLMDACERSHEEARLEYLIFFGYLRECARAEDIPHYLQPEFDEALRRALDLFDGSWADIRCDANTFRYALASLAALRNEVGLSRLLRNADCGCLNCGAVLLDRGR